MSALSLFPVFMVGLLGSVHCVGMCGGIVSAFSALPAASRPFPVALVVQRPADGAARALAYNTGRIASYMVAGAMAGVSGMQAGGYWLANLMLVALGLYLMNAWNGLTRLEVLGRGLWRHAQPLIKSLMPYDSQLKMLALGGLWGWLPCGMVYSVLLTAMLTGSAAGGAAVMLAFGLGTLPVLLAMGLMGDHLRGALQRPVVRFGAGMVVLAFGVLGLVRAASGEPLGWIDALCLAGSAA